MLLLSSTDFLQNLSVSKNVSGTLSECQTVWIKIRTDILLVLIWIQTVCHGKQQTVKVATSKEKVNHIPLIFKFHICSYIISIFVVKSDNAFQGYHLTCYYIGQHIRFWYLSDMPRHFQ